MTRKRMAVAAAIIAGVTAVITGAAWAAAGPSPSTWNMMGGGYRSGMMSGAGMTGGRRSTTRVCLPCCASTWRTTTGIGRIRAAGNAHLTETRSRRRSLIWVRCGVWRRKVVHGLINEYEQAA